MDTNTHDSKSLDNFSYHHAWRYFELHANQRISLFRNFVVILTLYITGSGFLLVKFHNKSNLEETGLIILSAVFITITIIFWLLDNRNRTLIHNAEDSIKEHEKYCIMDGTHRLFTKEGLNSTCELRHTFCFRALYIISIISASIVIMSSFSHEYIENSKNPTIIYYQIDQNSHRPITN